MFNYQGVARDAAGDALTSQAVGIRASILQGSSTGLSVYVDEHAVTTNAFGVFSLAVGNGTVASGTFSTIDWSSGPYYLNIEMDATGGTTYAQMGVAQLLSVPYALYANSGVGSQGPTGPIGPMGPAGVAGANGMNGADGATGPAGPAGPTGPQGATGATGDIGQIGPTGPTGADGTGIPAGTEGQTLIHNGTEWVASDKIKCNTPTGKVDVEGEGIRVHPPLPLPPSPVDEAELERDRLRFIDELNRAVELLKTATGGNLKAEDGQGGTAELELDAVEEALKVLTGRLIVLPDPGSTDEDAELTEGRLRFEKDLESALEALRTMDGGEVKAEAGGNEVKMHMDALNEIIRAVATGGIVVLPTPGSDEKSTLDEHKLFMEKLNEATLEMERQLNGAVIRSDHPNGNSVVNEFDSENGLFHVTAIDAIVEEQDSAGLRSRLNNSRLRVERDNVSSVELERVSTGGVLRAEENGGGLIEFEMNASNNEIVDNAAIRIQTDGNAQFIRGLVGTETVMQASSPSNGALLPASVHFIPNATNPQFFVNAWLAKLGGSFKIDHPLDPDNKYLYHSFVESPDMMNVYNGNITTGVDGEATVELPSYFNALNKDFRYQLTVIGTFAQAIVLEEIDGNSFKIKTDQPNVKVSWQVTGVRNDDFAKARRMKVEVEKEAEMKGKRLFEVK